MPTSPLPRGPSARPLPGRNSAHAVPPRRSAQPPPELAFVAVSPCGVDALLVVPTANASKVDTLAAAARRLLRAQRPGARLHVVQHPAASGVPEQPFDGEGVAGAVNRANATMRWLASAAGRAACRDCGAGTVLVGSIENYVDRRPPAADFGAVLLCDVTAGRAAWQFSAGITVPPGYVAAAAAATGTTVGTLLAADVPGVAPDDWHAYVSPHSRYALLGAAAAALELRLFCPPAPPARPAAQAGRAGLTRRLP